MLEATALVSRPEEDARLRWDRSTPERTHTLGPLTRDRVTIAGRTLRPTVVFDTYWRFAAERQAIYLRRVGGLPGPWTADSILDSFRFTNAYRASDRVSQFLIQRVIYSADPSFTWADRVFRTLLFKFFNRIETWEALEREFGVLTWDTYSFDRYADALDRRRASGEQLYSAAYVIPPPRFGETAKHRNHLRLLEEMMRGDLPGRLLECRSMSDAFELLVSYPSVGRFLGFQFLIDLNYAPDLGYSESEFVVAGPGARDGVRKCFGPCADGIEADVIRWVADTQEAHFRRLGLPVPSLWGRPLQLIDVQNLFCEVDKYARVAHPTIAGHSGRTRIKQAYRSAGTIPSPWFPPAWGINERVSVRAVAPALSTAGGSPHCPVAAR